MEDVITELLEKTPFTDLSYEEKLHIIENGRPQPELPELKTEHKEKKRAYTRYFNISNYQKYLWLAGSIDSNKLYCWPCLLFSTEVSPWNEGGFSSLNYLVTACDKHQKSLSHIRAFTALQIFGSHTVDYSINIQKKAADNLHNEKVKANRTVLKKLIDTIVFLRKQKCVFSDGSEVEDSTNKGMYIELLEFLASYDPLLSNHLKTESDFKATSSTVKDDIVESIACVIIGKIKSEIEDASFVALLLDETSDVTNKSQLATTLRYVDVEGNCQERFLHFTDVSSNRTSQGLLQHIINVVNDFDCSNKLIAHTFDGATVTPDYVFDLQNLVKCEYPAASFVYCNSHNLNSVLSESTSCIKECKQFFISLSGIPSFFSYSTNRITALKDFMKRDLPKVALSRWNFLSRFIDTVKNYRRNLIKFFLSIEDNPSDWTSEEVNFASGFVRFLLKFNTKLFLVIFHKIFTSSDILFDVFQNKSMDISYCICKVDKFFDALQQIKTDDFGQIWTEAESYEEEDNEPSLKRLKTYNDRSKYLDIFNEILDTLMIQIKLRFESLNCLKFVSLLNSGCFDEYLETFPEHLLSELKDPYVSHFDTARLKNELRVFYSLDDFKNKPVSDIICYMKLNKLDIVFNEIYKLAQLILTFPLTTQTTERNFSALDRIRSYLKGTQGQSCSANLAILSIENDVLLNMKRYSDETFYETVSDKFIQKGKRMEFMYK